MAAAPESPDGIEKIRGPPDEQGDHQVMDVDDELVHFGAMPGGEFGEA
jgi:hypothetical protein